MNALYYDVSESLRRVLMNELKMSVRCGSGSCGGWERSPNLEGEFLVAPRLGVFAQDHESREAPLCFLERVQGCVGVDMGEPVR